MSEHDMPATGNEGKTPVVFERDGRVFANSRDVAACFEKEVKHVHEAIRNLIAKAPKKLAPNFRPNEIKDLSGLSVESYDMTRDGFTILAMGFTGDRALGFKLRYIEQFNAMEATLKNPLAGFAIPRTLPEALRLAADQADTIERQRIELAMAAPKVDTYNRIANGDGMFNMTRAAKVLHQPPHAFMRRLNAEAWIYKRAGSDRWTAYQDKIYRGFLEHKTTTLHRPDGTDKVIDQVMVTPKGIIKLAAMFGVQPDIEVISAEAA